MKILCVTHSERSFLEARCDLNYLESRFQGSRFDQKINITSFGSIKEAVPYNGSLSIWKIDEINFSLSLLWSYAPKYKIQFASFHKNILAIYGSDRIEVLSTQFDTIKTITGPHVAGGHTLHFDEKGFAWINSAPGNMIMKVNIDNGEIIEKIIMPSIYGSGIDLGDRDLKTFFIPTDLQPTHVNCAYPHKESVYVTLLIQGAIGVYDSCRNYKEIISGFKGLHSGKINVETEQLYFTDSPAAMVWHFDLKHGKFSRRFKLDSRWVHDAEHIAKDIYAAGLSDDNSVQIFSTDQTSILQRYDMRDFGKSVMFLNCCEVDAQWEECLTAASHDFPRYIGKEKKRSNMLPNISNSVFWKLTEYSEICSHSDPEKESSIYLNSKSKLTYEYMLISQMFVLPAGKYKLEADIDCEQGGISIGLLLKKTDRWLVQFNLDAKLRYNFDEFDIDFEESELTLAISANNPGNKKNTSLFINKVRIEPLFELSESESKKILCQFDVHKVIHGYQTDIAELTRYASEKEKEVDALRKVLSNAQ